MLGDKDKGFEWMLKAYEVRSAALPYSNNWPVMDRAREDPRFIELLGKMKLQQVSLGECVARLCALSTECCAVAWTTTQQDEWKSDN